MTLQILVNHYNEDINIVRKFLETLNKQKDIKFEVIIISDGGKINLSNEDWSKYNFQIKYKYIKHVGVCHTRNILLNISSADYLMFCDIDDEFENVNGIKNMINKIKKKMEILQVLLLNKKQIIIILILLIKILFIYKEKYLKDSF